MAINAAEEAKLNNRRNEANQTYDGKRLSEENIKKDIHNIILEINKQLQKINDLAINDENRIQITERHLSQIDNIQGLQPERKEILKKALIAYTGFRVSSYKMTVDHAYEIEEAYRNNEIIDYKKRGKNDPVVEKNNLITTALNKINFEYKSRIVEVFSQYDNKFIEGRINDIITLMSFYANYFRGESKEIDLAEIDKFLNYDRNANHQMYADENSQLRSAVARIQRTEVNSHSK